MMADNKEQTVCVKFCFCLGKSAAETVLMLQEAFKEEALSKTQVYEWYSRFRNIFSSGKNVGTSVSSQKESTLKETRFVIVQNLINHF